MWFKLFFLLSIPQLASSVTFESRISYVDESPGEEALVFFDNGRVAFLPPLSSSLKDLPPHKNLRIDLDHRLYLKRAEVIKETTETLMPGTSSDFQPTVLPDNNAATEVFNHLRKGWQEESQCYNRAHVWAYEAHQRSGLKSIKLFLFFTSRYIRNYRHQWWFHVAPMTLISRNGKSYPKVLDRRYTSGPRDLQNWTNVFMKNKAVCPMIRKYSDYRKNQQSEDCYLFPASMYYYQPKDLENFERTGKHKTQFIQSEVDWAYREAF